MSTYTPYKREYNTRHGVEGFYASDYKLCHTEQLEIAEYLADALQTVINNGDNLDLYDIIAMVVSEDWMPAYYSETLRIWTESGTPEPESYEALPPEPTIWDMMNAALFEIAYEFASGLVWVTDNEPQTALNRINTIYPVKQRDPVSVIAVGF